MAETAIIPTQPDKQPDKDEEAAKARDMEIGQYLQGLRSTAEFNRKSGPNPRDSIWRRNIDIYWGNYDFSQKAEWQSRQVMPEAPNLVDRWAAAMKAALMSSPNWFTVIDPADSENDLTPYVEKLLQYELSKCGRSIPQGHELDFGAIFEDLMKLGTLAAPCVAVTWQHDRDNRGYLATEIVDPRTVLFDSTGRRYYRIRTYEVDKHDLLEMARQVDSSGEKIFDIEQINQLMAGGGTEHTRSDREQLTGQGQQQNEEGRKPIVIDEFLCDIVLNDNTVIGTNMLAVMANKSHLIRRPEPNPFWHKRDWLVYAPLISVPLSAYGRAYMESWSSLAILFNDMTNILVDGILASAMNAFAVAPDMLEDPTELEEGISPNKVFQLAEGVDVKNDFIKEIDLGRLDQTAFQMWGAIKRELQEGARLTELQLGQIPRGDNTATEAAIASEASSAGISSVAETVERTFLEPTLEIMWLTSLQHRDFNSQEMKDVLGEEGAAMLARRKSEFKQRRVRFQVRGITNTIQNARKLRALLSALGVVSQNEILLREFTQRYDPGKVFDQIMDLHGVDTKKLEPTERERQIRQIVQAQERATAALASVAGAGNPRANGATPPSGQGGSVALGPLLDQPGGTA